MLPGMLIGYNILNKKEKSGMEIMKLRVFSLKNSKCGKRLFFALLKNFCGLWSKIVGAGFLGFYFTLKIQVF